MYIPTQLSRLMLHSTWSNVWRSWGFLIPWQARWSLAMCSQLLANIACALWMIRPAFIFALLQQFQTYFIEDTLEMILHNKMRRVKPLLHSLNVFCSRFIGCFWGFVNAITCFAHQTRAVCATICSRLHSSDFCHQCSHSHFSSNRYTC